MDRLKSYEAAKREMLPSVEHRQHRCLNNRAENSHQPARQRERRLQRFISPGHAQRFLAAYGPIASHFRPRCHLCTAQAYRHEKIQRFQIWREITGRAAAQDELHAQKLFPFRDVEAARLPGLQKDPRRTASLSSMKSLNVFTT
jgi:hypothetical protein